ncbi:MAG TPA: hypothetical protein VF832_19695 [Longimicrobiales bacterium]
MRARSGAAAAWLIGAAAAGCGVWAVADFVLAARPDAPAAVLAVAPARSGAAVDLHQVLDQGEDAAGALVRVDGTVVGDPDAAGFWVRDLRDNVVYVASAERPRSGAAVRVLGRLARFGGPAGARLGPPADAPLVLRDLRIVTSGPAAVEVLRN